MYLIHNNILYIYINIDICIGPYNNNNLRYRNKITFSEIYLGCDYTADSITPVLLTADHHVDAPLLSENLRPAVNVFNSETV